jgi:hypothetical protein
LTQFGAAQSLCFVRSRSDDARMLGEADIAWKWGVDEIEGGGSRVSSRLLQSNKANNNNNDKQLDQIEFNQNEAPAAPPLPPQTEDGIAALQSALLAAMTDTLYSLLTVLAFAVTCHCKLPLPISTPSPLHVLS